MLIAEGTCGRWLGLCQYDDIDIGLAPLVFLAGQRSAKTFVLADLCLAGPESTCVVMRR